MNRTKIIYFLSAIVLIIGCYVLNLSYSLFIQTEEKDIVSSVVPKLVYSLENNKFNIPSKSEIIIKLKVINSGTADIRYGISVSDTKGAYIQLVKRVENDIVGTLSSSNVEGENSYKEVWVYVTNSTENDITDLTFDITAKYTTLNFDENFRETSNIDCNYVVKLLSEEILANARSGEEGRSIFTEPENLSTKPAEQINGENERILSYTEDDLGMSYYFRGNVIDNYVNFAGMCWRIVRIAGDGSIKMILDDQYAECDDQETTNTAAKYTGTWNIPTTGGNFGYNATKVNKKWIADYLNPGEKSVSGSMSTAFKNFQEDKLNTYKGDLKAGGWCYADDAYATSSVDLNITQPLTESEKEAIYKSGTYNEERGEWENTQKMYYDSYVRLYGNSKKSPTLKCNGTTMDKFGDNTTDMYVGTLTAEEVVYAGGKVYGSNSSYYLLNDYQRVNPIYWWLVSPRSFNGSYDDAFRVNNMGTLVDSGVAGNSALRPAVSLVFSVKITDGVGTIDDPYVVG